MNGSVLETSFITITISKGHLGSIVIEKHQETYLTHPSHTSQPN
uniref:Uncharacterized protein n=1 Tax=Rhizophora mucronata TaxID=61149 RepID=A0A2P2KTM0_RHIMU